MGVIDIGRKFAGVIIICILFLVIALHDQPSREAESPPTSKFLNTTFIYAGSEVFSAEAEDELKVLIDHAAEEADSEFRFQLLHEQGAKVLEREWSMDPVNETLTLELAGNYKAAIEIDGDDPVTLVLELIER